MNETDEKTEWEVHQVYKINGKTNRKQIVTRMPTHWAIERDVFVVACGYAFSAMEIHVMSAVRKWTFQRSDTNTMPLQLVRKTHNSCNKNCSLTKCVHKCEVCVIAICATGLSLLIWIKHTVHRTQHLQYLVNLLGNNIGAMTSQFS